MKDPKLIYQVITLGGRQSSVGQIKNFSVFMEELAL